MKRKRNRTAYSNFGAKPQKSMTIDVIVTSFLIPDKADFELKESGVIAMTYSRSLQDIV